MHSLPWVQHKRWIPIGSMGCEHMHQKILTIEGFGSSIHIQSIMEKIKEDNQKARKIGQDVSQAFTPRLKFEKIQKTC